MVHNLWHGPDATPHLIQTTDSDVSQGAEPQGECQITNLEVFCKARAWCGHEIHPSV
jgi:hypothetical protein